MRTTTSFLLGVILAGINLTLLVRIVRQMTGESSRSKLIALVTVKFLLVFGIISLILWKGHVSPLGFLAGFSIPLVGYLCMNLRGSD